MANSSGSGQRRQTGTTRPVLRPLTWSAMVTAAAAAAFATPQFATPAYAEPPLPDTIPDPGARPVPTGAVQLPGVGPATVQPTAPAPALVNGPLAAEAHAKDVAVAALGDQVLELREERKAAYERLAAAEARLREAHEAMADALAAAEAMATNALKDAAGLPPGTFGSDLHGLAELSRLPDGHLPTVDASAAERELAAAQAAEEAASEEVRALRASATDVDGRYLQKQEEHRLAEASQLQWRRDHAPELQLIERQQEAFDRLIGANFVGRGSRSGMVAHPKALIAVQYALAQLGDRYLWAAEGPDRFDCSGLMWAAYRAAGFELPRVARDQFYATRARMVSRYDLLPGDLIFFGSGPSWTSIYHVGMYVGNGRMVHAPRTGDVVKVSTVQWTRFYAATRIFGEVPAPSLPPITSRPPVVTPPSSGVSTPTTTPRPSGSPTPSPTRPSGSPTPSPTTPAPSPTTPAPSPTTPAPSPTTASPSPEPTATASPEATTGTSPEPAPATSSTASEPAPATSDPAPTADSSSPTATEPTTSPSTTASTAASTGGS